MSDGDWLGGGALALSAGALLTTFLRTARMQGGDRQRLRFVEESVGRLASAESLSALATRVDELEGDVKLVAAALAKVAVIEAKLDALDRLMTRETDEIKHSLRGLESRGLDVAPGSPRSRRASSG